MFPRILLATLCLGCSNKLDDEPERVVVFGKVTYAGKPIETGEIRLMPLEGTTAPSSGARIEDGNYRIDHKGGAPIGTFQVVISAYKAAGGGAEIPGAVDDPMAGRKQVLPDKYSTSKSELRITIETGEESIEKDFHLEE